MANYSRKNLFFEAFFPPLLSIISRGEISSSFDFAPSQLSFHQDMSQNLKGAVSAKRSLLIYFFFPFPFYAKTEMKHMGKKIALNFPFQKEKQDLAAAGDV